MLKQFAPFRKFLSLDSNLSSASPPTIKHPGEILVHPTQYKKPVCIFLLIIFIVFRRKHTLAFISNDNDDYDEDDDVYKNLYFYISYE